MAVWTSRVLLTQKSSEALRDWAGRILAATSMVLLRPWQSRVRPSRWASIWDRSLRNQVKESADICVSLAIAWVASTYRSPNLATADASVTQTS